MLESKIMEPAWSGSGEGPILCCRQLLSHCVLTWQKENELALCSLPKRALIPFRETPPSWPNSLPKTPSPQTITLCVRFQYSIWVGQGRWHKHVIHNTEENILFLRYFSSHTGWSFKKRQIYLFISLHKASEGRLYWRLCFGLWKETGISVHVLRFQMFKHWLKCIRNFLVWGDVSLFISTFWQCADEKISFWVITANPLFFSDANDFSAWDTEHLCYFCCWQHQTASLGVGSALPGRFALLNTKWVCRLTGGSMALVWWPCGGLLPSPFTVSGKKVEMGEQWESWKAFSFCFLTLPGVAELK